MAATVPYYPGNGNTYYIVVDHIADYPRGEDGTCAFCCGDPLGEAPAKKFIIQESRIRLYYMADPHAETCPMCEGRPS